MPLRRAIFLYTFVALLLGAQTALAQSTLSRDRKAYRDLYAEQAIAQMKEFGIPASITLAQGMLESGNGKSRLAVKANNHFGIKCHKDWSGRKIYEDDDARGECFRVYRSVKHSFRDHAAFLRGARRYAFLFDLAPTDYKGWAKGLKKAGYATDPSYAQRLIKIIEEEELYLLDRGIVPESPAPSRAEEARPVDDSRIAVRIGRTHKIYSRNRVEYTVVLPHDTYASLTASLEMLSWELQKYNELPNRQLPPPGTVLYLQPKRRKADIAYTTHVVEEGQSLWEIAQMYAVKTSALIKKNRLPAGYVPQAGDLLYLRKNKPRD